MVKINKRYWGLSNWTVVTRDWEFVNSKNISTDEEKCWLGGKATTIATISEDLTCGVNIEWAGYMLGEDWVWHKVSTWAKVLQTTWWDDIMNVTTFDDKVLFFYRDWTTPYIGKLDIDDVWGSTSRQTETSYDETRKTFTSQWTEDHFHTTQFSLMLYITHWKYIHTLDTNWVLTQDVLITTSNIVWITNFQNRFKVFLKDWTVLLWDWISETYESSISLNDYIRWVKSMWGIDYVAGWYSSYYSSFYEVAYPQFKQLNKETDWPINWTDSKFDFNMSYWAYWDSWMGVYQGDLYIGTGYNLVKYWQLSPLFPKTFTNIVGSWESSTIKPMAVLPDVESGTIYFYDSTGNTISKVEDNLSDEGNISTRQYNYWTDTMIVNEVKVRCHIPYSTRTMRLLYRKDNSTGWYYFGDEISDISSESIVVVRDVVEFNNIQRWIKFTYTGTDTDNYAPTVRELDFNPLPVKR